VVNLQKVFRVQASVSVLISLKAVINLEQETKEKYKK
jgi:hypothetical protein